MGKLKPNLIFKENTEKEDEDISWALMRKMIIFADWILAWMVTAGIELKFIQIGLSYNLGLANISSFREEGATIKTR